MYPSSMPNTRVKYSDYSSFPGYPVKTSYLTAGLYSIAHEGETTVQNAAKSKQQKILPLPQNYGEWFLNTKRDFSLPYDIIFELDHGLIDRKRTPLPYTVIKSSILSSLDIS